MLFHIKSLQAKGWNQRVDQRVMMCTQDGPTMLASQSYQGRRRFLEACDHLKIGPELSASFPKKGDSALGLGRNEWQPFSGRLLQVRRGVPSRSAVRTRRRNPQGLANTPEDFFALSDFHRFLQ
jgi:hypothetical protein